MVAALTKLHDDVQDGSLARARILAGDGLDVAKEQPLVQLLLYLRHADHDEGFGLGGQALRNVDFHPAQHERTEDAVQLSDHGFLRIGVVHLEIKPLVELFRRREDVGKEEVEQRPELVQIVL